VVGTHLYITGSTENNSYLADEGVAAVRTHLSITGSTKNNSYLADDGVVVVRTHLYIIGSTENTTYFAGGGGVMPRSHLNITWLNKDQLLTLPSFFHRHSPPRLLTRQVRKVL
jgi:hypothetical protein